VTAPKLAAKPPTLAVNAKQLLAAVRLVKHAALSTTEAKWRPVLSAIVLRQVPDEDYDPDVHEDRQWLQVCAADNYRLVVAEVPASGELAAVLEQPRTMAMARVPMLEALLVQAGTSDAMLAMHDDSLVVGTPGGLLEVSLFPPLQPGQPGWPAEGVTKILCAKRARVGVSMGAAYLAEACAAAAKANPGLPVRLELGHSHRRVGDPHRHVRDATMLTYRSAATQGRVREAIMPVMDMDYDRAKGAPDAPHRPMCECFPCRQAAEAADRERVAALQAGADPDAVPADTHAYAPASFAGNDGSDPCVFCGKGRPEHPQEV
jgi:hypothetical protein